MKIKSNNIYQVERKPLKRYSTFLCGIGVLGYWSIGALKSHHSNTPLLQHSIILTRSIRYSFVAVVLLLSSFNGLFAQASLIEVDASVDKSTITIGDRINYTLKINRDQALQVHDPGKGTNLGMFEIKDYRVFDPVVDGNRVIEKFEYTIAVYDTGRFVIPPFPVAFKTADSTAQHQLIMSDPLEIFVESIVNDENAEIKDIRPPLEIPADYVRLALIIGGIVLVLVIIGVIYWWNKKRKEGKPIFRKEVIRPAHEIALEELQQLLESDLLQAGKLKAFYSILSEILRRYIEGRFYIKALEETTTELVSSLQNTEISPENITAAKKVLDACDLVKFAKYFPQQPEIEEAIQHVRGFIDRTRLEFAAVENLQEVTETAEAVGSKPETPSKIQSQTQSTNNNQQSTNT